MGVGQKRLYRLGETPPFTSYILQTQFPSRARRNPTASTREGPRPRQHVGATATTRRGPGAHDCDKVLRGLWQHSHCRFVRSMLARTAPANREVEWVSARQGIGLIRAPRGPARHTDRSTATHGLS